jgi:hypothetical protein
VQLCALVVAGHDGEPDRARGQAVLGIGPTDTADGDRAIRVEEEGGASRHVEDGAAGHHGSRSHT